MTASASRSSRSTRNLVLVLGDQLNMDSSAFDGFDRKCDVVWMREVRQEATHVWSHRARIALFLSAMRHLRDALQRKRFEVDHREFDDRKNTGSLAEELLQAARALEPERLVLTTPGEWRVLDDLRGAAKAAGIPLELREDRHFMCSRSEFEEHCRGRRQLRMEHFYREMRRRSEVLMAEGEPVGGRWNFDADNRSAFGSDGPPEFKSPLRHCPDQITREVIELVRKGFPDHPGGLDDFIWPVTPAQAKRSLRHFVKHRLPTFGPHQDAMWEGEPFLSHSLLSCAMNLKLLDPRDVVRAAEEAHSEGSVPIASAEGFIRQILGWREYVRGVYWRMMPEYADRNALGADLPLPDLYWTGETEMSCLREVIAQTLRHGYAHHIQRLMVTGLFALLLGVEPRRVHEWYLAIYVDAVEWVELPNTLGMSQFADGGVMASKPYVATGKYIRRMSNHCGSCRYNPDNRTGDDSCPFTTLYWDFLMRHERALSRNGRMTMQLRNLKRLSASERRAVKRQASSIREDPDRL